MFRRMIDSGEVSRGDKMALRRTDPKSYVIEYTLVYEGKMAYVGRPSSKVAAERRLTRVGRLFTS